MNTDRFQPPGAADEMAHCQGCDGRFHHAALDDNSRCVDCRGEDDKPETMKGCPKCGYHEGHAEGCEPSITTDTMNPTNPTDK